MFYVSIYSWYSMCFFFVVIFCALFGVFVSLFFDGLAYSQVFVCLIVFSCSGFKAFRFMCSRFFVAFFELFPICVFKVLPFCVFRRSPILFSCLQVFLVPSRFFVFFGMTLDVGEMHLQLGYW